MDSITREVPKFNHGERLPNDAMQGIMTPSGFGGYGTYIFGGIGGVYPAVYTTKPDLGGAIGFCIGNSAKFLNLAVSANITKVQALEDLSTNIVISRKLFKGTSIAIGGLQLFANSTTSDSPASTFYAAISHSVQWAPSKSNSGSSALTYTIGYGNGRFLLKSPFDVANGKGTYGTGFFGGISYEVFKHVNLNAEWTGMNLGLSLGIRPFNNALSFGIGASDLTQYTGDKPSMIFSLGYPLSLNRKLTQPKNPDRDTPIF